MSRESPLREFENDASSAPRLQRPGTAAPFVVEEAVSAAGAYMWGDDMSPRLSSGRIGAIGAKRTWPTWGSSPGDCERGGGGGDSCAALAALSRSLVVWSDTFSDNRALTADDKLSRWREAIRLLARRARTVCGKFRSCSSPAGSLAVRRRTDKCVH